MSPERSDESSRQGHGPAAVVRPRLLVDEALSGDAVQVATNAQRALPRVDVRPPQAEGLRLPQSHGQRDGPSGGAAVGPSGREHLSGFRSAQGSSHLLHRGVGGFAGRC